jgi:hypothetical protein
MRTGYVRELEDVILGRVFTAERRQRRRRTDAAVVAGLLAMLGLLLLRYVNLSAVPLEDAAMLMRYAENLAHGHGVVWNVGERPVDGATDFLFMVLAAAGIRLGLSAQAAVRLIDIVSIVATIPLVYFTARRLHGSGRIVAGIAAAFVVTGRDLYYTEAGFGAPFFGLTVATTWLFAMRCRRDPSSRPASLGFATSALLMGLTRPEGVLLAAFMLVAVVLAVGPRRALRVVSATLLVFGTLGLGYFLWRWHYFGYPLPNAFYKKGGGHLYPHSLKEAIRQTAAQTFPFIVLYPLSLRSREGAREALFSLVPVTLFTSIWILLSGEMNFLGRFQYPAAMVVVMSWPGLVPHVVRGWQLPRFGELDRRARLLFLSLVLLSVFGHDLSTFESKKRMSSENGLLAIAQVLARYESRSYRLATTEAGILPLYSGWRSVDTWGLNDQEIAHEGSITARQLEAFDPDVIVFHASFSPVMREGCVGPEFQPGWNEMTVRLRQFATQRHYRLVAAYGIHPYDTFYHYVRRDFPDSDSLVAAIGSTNYVMPVGNERAMNFAAVRGKEDDLIACGPPATRAG